MILSEAIGLCGSVILSIGMISVLFYGFRVQDNIPKWKKEIENRHIPELLREKEPINMAAAEKPEVKEDVKES